MLSLKGTVIAHNWHLFLQALYLSQCSASAYFAEAVSPGLTLRHDVLFSLSLFSRAFYVAVHLLAAADLRSFHWLGALGIAVMHQLAQSTAKVMERIEHLSFK